VVGPHPYPYLVRELQAVIGREARGQVIERAGGLPDLVVACVGGGSNAIGLFHGFLGDPSVEILGIEAGGHGTGLGENAATLSFGRPGVLHGTYSLLLSDDDGQVYETDSVSAGLDYPGVGPEHAFLHTIGRVRYEYASDTEALAALDECCELEGILPALETAHAFAGAKRWARANPASASCSASRAAATRTCRRWRSFPSRSARDECRQEPARADQRRDPRRAASGPHRAGRFHHRRLPGQGPLPRDAGGGGGSGRRGRGGVPFSDPMADGLTIQRASRAAIAQGVTLSWILDEIAAMEPPPAAPVVLMSYLNPLLAMGYERLAARAVESGVAGFIVPDLPLDESEPLDTALATQGLALIHLVSPVTPPERIAAAARASRGFLYAVNITGITGGAKSANANLKEYLGRVVAASPVPVCAGFGIRSAAQVADLAGVVPGVIVGSALVEALERGESPASFLGGLA
jgi:tryptophan synthase alpha chain